jgi:hypothetical protein
MSVSDLQTEESNIDKYQKKVWQISHYYLKFDFFMIILDRRIKKSKTYASGTTRHFNQGTWYWYRSNGSRLNMHHRKRPFTKKNGDIHVGYPSSRFEYKEHCFHKIPVNPWIRPIPIRGNRPGYRRAKEIIHLERRTKPL